MVAVTEGDASRQKRDDSRPGIPVDASGNATIDPTKNVLDLVYAESKYQDSMRNAEARIQKMAVDSLAQMSSYRHDAESKMQTWMRDAETKRIDQLTATRENYEKRIADMLSESVRSTSSLVSTQLLQIQSTFDARVNKLEEFRLMSQGRSSVADPQLASTLSTLGQNMQDMQSIFTKTLADYTRSQALAVAEINKSVGSVKDTQSGTTNNAAGRQQLINWVVQALMLLAAIGGPIIAILSLRKN
jgi:hypothetical protein